MNIGAMMGGAFQGGMKVWDQFQQEDKLRIDREKADREKTQFDEAQTLKETLRNIAGQEAGANADRQAVEGYSKATPAGTLIPNESGPVTATGDVAKDSIAIGTTNINADQSLSDADKTSQIASMTSGVQAAWKPKYGLVPDSVNAYRFGTERANALQSAGHFKEAREERGYQQDQAVGAAISAGLNGDHRTLNSLNTIWDRAGKSPEVRGFDTKGNFLVANPDGSTRAIPKYDALMGIAAQASSPEKTMQLLTSRANREEMDEIRRLLGLRAADTAEAKVLGGTAGRAGSGAAGAGSGSGATGAGGGGLYGQPGIKTQKDWDDWVTTEANKDNPPSININGKDTTVDLAKYRAEFGDAAYKLVTTNPGLLINDAAPLARRLARAQFVPDAGVVVSPGYDNTTGQITMGASVDGKQVHFGTQELSGPEVTNIFMKQVQNPDNKEQVAAAQAKASSFLIYATAQQTAYIAGKFDELDKGGKIVERGVAYSRPQYIKSFFGNDASKYEAARGLAAWRFTDANKARLALTTQRADEGLGMYVRPTVAKPVQQSAPDNGPMYRGGQVTREAAGPVLNYLTGGPQMVWAGYDNAGQWMNYGLGGAWNFGRGIVAGPDKK